MTYTLYETIHVIYSYIRGIQDHSCEEIILGQRLWFTWRQSHVTKLKQIIILIVYITVVQQVKFIIVMLHLVVDILHILGLVYNDKVNK